MASFVNYLSSFTFFYYFWSVCCRNLYYNQMRKPRRARSLDLLPPSVHTLCVSFSRFSTFTNSLHVLILHNVFLDLSTLLLPLSVVFIVLSIHFVCASDSLVFSLHSLYVCRFFLNKYLEVVKYLVAYTASESRK